MKRLIDVIGQRFGKWQVLSKAPVKKNCAQYLCICDCGNERIVSGQNMRAGKSTQCKPCRNNAHKGWYERRNTDQA